MYNILLLILDYEKFILFSIYLSTSRNARALQPEYGTHSLLYGHLYTHALQWKKIETQKIYNCYEKVGFNTKYRSAKEMLRS
jgi:hypothetical protein